MPIPENECFQQPVLHHQLRQCFFELRGLRAHGLHLIRGRFLGGVTGQALFACFQEFLRPAVVQILIDAFTAAQPGDTIFATLGLRAMISRPELATHANIDALVILLDRKRGQKTGQDRKGDRKRTENGTGSFD